MIITELSLTNFRGYENAQFIFQPGSNLIACVKGTGKSTALEAIGWNAESTVAGMGGMA